MAEGGLRVIQQAVVFPSPVQDGDTGVVTLLNQGNDTCIYRVCINISGCVSIENICGVVDPYDSVDVTVAWIGARYDRTDVERGMLLVRHCIVDPTAEDISPGRQRNNEFIKMLFSQQPSDRCQETVVPFVVKRPSARLSSGSRPVPEAAGVLPPTNSESDWPEGGVECREGSAGHGGSPATPVEHCRMVTTATYFTPTKGSSPRPDAEDDDDEPAASPRCLMSNSSPPSGNRSPDSRPPGGDDGNRAVLQELYSYKALAIQLHVEKERCRMDSILNLERAARQHIGVTEATEFVGVHERWTRVVMARVQAWQARQQVVGENVRAALWKLQNFFGGRLQLDGGAGRTGATGSSDLYSPEN